MFRQDVLLFERFQRTYKILINVPAKTCRSGKERIALSQRWEGNTLISEPLSNHQRAPCPENKLCHIINSYSDLTLYLYSIVQSNRIVVESITNTKSYS